MPVAKRPFGCAFVGARMTTLFVLVAVLSAPSFAWAGGRSMPASYMRRNYVATNARMSAEDGGATTTTNEEHASSSVAANVNNDLLEKMSWQCANNASCLYSLANGVLQSYRRGDIIRFGIFELVKLSAANKAHSQTAGADFAGSGRAVASFMDFLSGNALRIPVGPMVFSVQRAEDNGNYIEIALLKKATHEGRRGGEGGGGLLDGGGGGGGGGGGHLGGGGIRERLKQQKDKKQFQMLIPMYLAATTFGWTMVAAKAVGLLTLKALVISKLAFIVAAGVIIKKLMDNASEKMMYQYPEHSPYMMPYSMDYPMHAMGGAAPAEIATNDMYPAALHLAAAAAASPMAQPGHLGMEALGAESSLHHNFADVHNNTQVLAALNAAGLGQKVKREDSWMAKASAARRPLMYNFMQPQVQQHPFYRPSQ